MGLFDIFKKEEVDELGIITQAGKRIASSVTALEQYRKIISSAQAGENVGILLQGIDRNELI